MAIQELSRYRFVKRRSEKTNDKIRLFSEVHGIQVECLTPGEAPALVQLGLTQSEWFHMDNAFAEQILLWHFND